jgi:hypothetical protein
MKLRPGAFSHPGLFVLCALLLSGSSLYAQSGRSPEGDPSQGIVTPSVSDREPGREPVGGSVLYPDPVPFSLDTESAINCIELLRSVRFIERRDDGGSGVIKIETVWSYFLGYDESFPEGHRLRYDIIVNGEPLDWDKCFIEYGEDMLNLRLLFLYRNQHPGRDLEYRG